RYRRKIRRVDTANIGIEPVAFDGYRLRLLVERHRQWLIWMSGHEVGQEPRWHRDAARFLDLGWNHLADADLQVGRGQLKPGVGGLKEHVVEDRQGSPR